MAYSDFTLDTIEERLGVTIHEQKRLFADIPPQEPTFYLKVVLEHESVFSTNSEKARSERYISPILDAIFSQIPDTFTVFSGVNFEVDKESGLRGIADYIICISNVRLYIQAPVIAVAESKRYDSMEGMAQCIAELVAAAKFNEKKEKKLDKLYGISTNGDDWMFGQLEVETNIFTYDPHKYSLTKVNTLLGILTFLRDDTLRRYQNKIL